MEGSQGGREKLTDEQRAWIDGLVRQLVCRIGGWDKVPPATGVPYNTVNGWRYSDRGISALGLMRLLRAAGTLDDEFLLPEPTLEAAKERAVQAEEAAKRLARRRRGGQEKPSSG